jgi:hypothetical protein
MSKMGKIGKIVKIGKDGKDGKDDRDGKVGYGIVQNAVPSRARGLWVAVVSKASGTYWGRVTTKSIPSREARLSIDLNVMYE